MYGLKELKTEEGYALKILNRAVGGISIKAKEKVELCNKFVQEIRSDRQGEKE